MSLSKFDYRMFEMARQEALTSDFAQFHLGCVIVYKKHIIGRGHNSNKTHRIQKKYNRRYRKFNKCGAGKPVKDSVHAEIAALASIPYPIQQNIKWSDVRVYIYRICPGKDLGYGNARCCPACIHAIKDKGIKKIYYSTDSGFAMEELF